MKVEAHSVEEGGSPLTIMGTEHHARQDCSCISLMFLFTFLTLIFQLRTIVTLFVLVAFVVICWIQSTLKDNSEIKA